MNEQRTRRKTELARISNKDNQQKSQQRKVQDLQRKKIKEEGMSVLCVLVKEREIRRWVCIKEIKRKLLQE